MEPPSDGLQPTSDGLLPTSDGLQATSDASNLLAMASNLHPVGGTSTLNANPSGGSDWGPQGEKDPNHSPVLVRARNNNLRVVEVFDGERVVDAIVRGGFSTEEAGT